jgi:hypothetical protein
LVVFVSVVFDLEFLDSVPFIVVVSFFLAEDLVDRLVAGLGFFPTSFFFNRLLSIFLVLDVLFFCIPIGVVSTSFRVQVSEVVVTSLLSF